MKIKLYNSFWDKRDYCFFNKHKTYFLKTMVSEAIGGNN